MFKEFRTFIIKGNAFDLAVGVIIGAAFSGVVNSLVQDILMPPIGYIMGGINFSDYFVDLSALAGRALGGDARVFASLDAARKAGHAVIAYGAFLNALINLAIVGVALFIVVRQVNRLRSAAEEAPAEAKVPQDVQLLTEIRDILARDREA